MITQEMEIDPYEGFLEDKIVIAPKQGFPIDSDTIHRLLKPHQADVVEWNLQGGCRANFLSFGLGKTMIQLETLRQIHIHKGGNMLIVCPLGVKHEFVRDGLKLGIERIKYITSTEEIEEGQSFYITNYERIRRGSINPIAFTAVSFDEASILRSLDTDTTQTILETFRSVPFRYVCTATPSPNRYLELINYADYLGIMDRGQALTRFFERDSTTAGNLTLYARREREFWLWMSSWAVFITKPSELGYSDEGYDLPQLEIIPHLVSFEREMKVDKKTGQATFIADSTKSLVDAAAEKRDSLPHRVSEVQQILLNCIKSLNYASDNGGAETIPESLLRAEQRGSVSQTTGAQQEALSGKEGIPFDQKQEVGGGKPGTNEGVANQKDANSGMESLPERSLSKQQGIESGPNSNQLPETQVQPNAGGVQCDADGSEPSLSDLQSDSAGIGPKSKRKSGSRSLSQNGQGEGATVPSLQRGTGTVSGQPRPPEKGHRLPGQLLIWCDLNSEQKAIEAVLKQLNISFVSLHGSEDADKRERWIEDWKDKKVDVFLSKPAMYGQGLNMQQASLMIFAGITYKFQEFIQAIHRIYRFGQNDHCKVHVIYTDAEEDIYKTLMQKWANHITLQTEMTAIIKKYGINADLKWMELTRAMFQKRVMMQGENWVSINNDSVKEWKNVPSDSQHLIVTSIPFGNHYEYSENYNCFGHNKTNEEFFRQMDYLVPELYRGLMPGRIACIHVKDRIRYGYQNGAGFISIDPFSDDTTACFRKHGFHLMARITVDTDVVRENNGTYRLSWTEACKDMTKMGAGLPEYVLVFRKAPSSNANSYADLPVVHQKENYSVARWQLDAHAHWKTSGERLLSTEYLKKLDFKAIQRLWKELDTTGRYDYQRHVELAEKLDEIGRLSREFMVIPPQSNHPDIWDDITRMRTLNSSQVGNKAEKHICPLQLDIIERCIERYSNPGEIVADPFGGIGSTGHQSVKMKRKAFLCELKTEYWEDGLRHLKGAEAGLGALTLFDLN